MPMVPNEQIDKVTRNRYEAVIIAARHARHLNARRLEQVAQLEEGVKVDIDGRKITGIALQHLVDGKIQYNRVAESEDEE